MSDQFEANTNTVVTLPEDQPDESPPPHPVADAIDRYLHSTRDIQLAARVFIPAAGQLMNKMVKDMKSGFDNAEALMVDADPGNRAHGLKLALANMRQAKRLQYSRLPLQLENSLFVSLFSSFDVFTGELLSALHLLKPALFDRLNRTVPLSTVLAASSLEMLKASALDDEIETFRRKSYCEQFDYLENSVVV